MSVQALLDSSITKSDCIVKQEYIFSGGRMNGIRNSNHTYITYTAVVIFLISSIWIILQNNGRILVSADFNDTLLIWHHWVVVGVPFIVLLLLPSKSEQQSQSNESKEQVLRTQTYYLLFLALSYFLALLITPFENVFDYFYIYKLIFLLIIPLLLLRRKPEKRRVVTYSAKNYWEFALIPVGIWIVMYYFSPWGPTQSNTYEVSLLILMSGAVVSFLLNSVLEELFYRVWLQTRLEFLLGTWPAISISTILWATWHIAIQTAGSVDVTLANAIANHGLMGVFLGLLWAKYRNFWALIIVHGLTNFPLEIVNKLFGE